MMAQHNETGSTGEQLAWEFLQQKGYRLLERNWRTGHLEVDLIVAKDDWIVFVEVKTRSTATLGAPEEFIGQNKIRNLIEAADRYVRRKNISLEARFDIVSVVINKNAPVIYHIEAAFTPEF